MADRSYLSARRRTGGGSPRLTAHTKTRIAGLPSARFKAILILKQACRLKFSHFANGTVLFICVSLGRPPAAGLFSIAAP